MQVFTTAELHEMRGAVAGRKLHEAQAVARHLQPHRFSVDGNQRAEFEVFRQVALVDVDGQWRLGPALTGMLQAPRTAARPSCQ